jgi:hypothetical protein
MAIIALDTETDESEPYSIQWSNKPGSAYMILVKNTPVLDKFRWYINEKQPTVVMHNALYDLEVLAKLGIYPKDIRDSQQEIYHLGGTIPQGLKAAVYRVFGFRMTSYDDVVTPASKAKLDGWLAEALAYVIMEMRSCIQHPKGKGCPACGKNHRLARADWQPHSAEAVIRRVMNHLDGDYDPWQAVKYDKGEPKPRLIGREWLASVEAGIGRMPRLSIVHAPLDRQIQYACGDADWTGRLATWLEGERRRIQRDEWRVA